MAELGKNEKKQVTEKTSGNLASKQLRLWHTLSGEIENGLADLENLSSDLSLASSFFYIFIFLTAYSIYIF